MITITATDLALLQRYNAALIAGPLYDILSDTSRP